VIAIGSDIDCIPQASQKPGAAYHDPIVAGAPGHGEGHNSGQPLNITARACSEGNDGAATHVRNAEVMGGVAKEQLGSKAYFVRAGMLKDVDICIFTHVAANFGAASRVGPGNGLILIEYSFTGESARPAMKTHYYDPSKYATYLEQLGIKYPTVKN
jgi:aminobenzoyl-glutamate utilization protein B